ncbi:glycosyltransferase [Pontibacter aydingkolensis]|uniref:Glycosyltransferase n=1 Tax=Pontibacter aydingkolensis TaxID=1911536 RepID=A0ABS7CZ42_9BACT|nr:glycosyltransferase [Pontibacter aydingkolensis]
MLVSVVTIVYNGDQFLEQTILSVLNQTYTNIEYIIVDGGSKDNTLEIIRKYEDKIAYWKSEPDKGISDAFNKGIELATGTLVGILNADDWLEPDAIAAVVANYKPGCVLHGNMQYWNPDGSKGMHVMPNAALLPIEMTINHPTVFIDIETYNRFGAFSTDYRLAMDYHLLLRLYKSNVSFIHVDKTIANMRSGGASGNWVNSYIEVRKAKDEILGKSLNHVLTYYWQVLRRHTSETIADSPLSFINKIYRRYFSPMRKL